MQCIIVLEFFYSLSYLIRYEQKYYLHLNLILLLFNSTGAFNLSNKSLIYFVMFSYIFPFRFRFDEMWQRLETLVNWLLPLWIWEEDYLAWSPLYLSRVWGVLTELTYRGGTRLYPRYFTEKKKKKTVDVTLRIGKLNKIEVREDKETATRACLVPCL